MYKGLFYEQNTYVWFFLTCCNYTFKKMFKELVVMMLLTLFIYFYFYFGHARQHVGLPQLGMEPVPTAVGAWSFNHWTAREVSVITL